MERKTANQEPMTQMTQTMGQLPMNNMPNYPYFIPDYHTMQNYPQMAMYGNRQPMNGYQYQMEQPREEQPFPQSPTQKNQINQKVSSSNQPTTEKQKIKPYINLLITTVNNLFKEEKISLKYLNEKTEHKTNHQNTGTNNSNNAINTNTNLRKASETSSLNNTNSNKKSCGGKKSQNALQPNHLHINENHQKSNHKNESCENPFCRNTFNTNKDRYKTKIKGLKLQEKNLCKMCYEAFEKGHFCYYCNSIYRDGIIDFAEWVECDYCRGWEHFNCEIEKGKKYANKQELEEKEKIMLLEEKLKYQNEEEEKRNTELEKSKNQV